MNSYCQLILFHARGLQGLPNLQSLGSLACNAGEPQRVTFHFKTAWGQRHSVASEGLAGNPAWAAAFVQQPQAVDNPKCIPPHRVTLLPFSSMCITCMSELAKQHQPRRNVAGPRAQYGWDAQRRNRTRRRTFQPKLRNAAGATDWLCQDISRAHFILRQPRLGKLPPKEVHWTQNRHHPGSCRAL